MQRWDVEGSFKMQRVFQYGREVGHVKDSVRQCQTTGFSSIQRKDESRWRGPIYSLIYSFRQRVFLSAYKQAPGIRHSPFCQGFMPLLGGTNDRTMSTECKYCGVGRLEWEGRGSHERIPRRGDLSADPKGHVGCKKGKEIETGVPERGENLGKVRVIVPEMRVVLLRLKLSNVLLLSLFYFWAERFYLFFYVEHGVIAH